MDKANNRETIKKLLIGFRERGVPADLEERRIEVDMGRKKANLLTGIRRAGKTYRMFQLIEKLGKRAFYINFEDERIVNPNVEDLSELLPIIKETFEVSRPLYLFVDEVQNVKGWEKWARRISEKKDVILFLSGSSSKLSSREIATSLRGRSLTTYIFPLSFKEFLDFKGTQIKTEDIEYSQEKPKIKRYFNEYLKYGGFPEIVLEGDKNKKLKVLQEYFSTIVARDLIERCSINKVNALKSFMKLLTNNFSRLISFSKTKGWLASIGIKISKSTLIKYFDYLRSSYFFFDTTIYSKSVKDRLQYPRKVYLVDNGFATALTERFSSDRGWYFENLMAVALYKKTVSNPKKELHYWKKGSKEVDFVVRNGIETEKLIQVCSDLNERTKEREVENLLTASEELGCDNLMVITEDSYMEEEIKGKKVEFLPLWMELLKLRNQ